MHFEIFEALLLGSLAAVTIIYTFQTRVLYPEWLLKSYEHPWIYLCVIIVAIFIGQSSPRIAAMIVLLLIALIFDWVLFAHHSLNQGDDDPSATSATATPSSAASSTSGISGDVAEVWPFLEPNARRVEGIAETALPFADF